LVAYWQVVKVAELCPLGMLAVWTPQRDESIETVAPVVHAAPAEDWTFTVRDVPWEAQRSTTVAV
jgi:hypothetical protein